jgi:hypothetical protein
MYPRAATLAQAILGNVFRGQFGRNFTNPCMCRANKTQQGAPWNFCVMKMTYMCRSPKTKAVTYLCLLIILLFISFVDFCIAFLGVS